MSVRPTVEPRTLAPPERRVAKIVANERVGAYSLLTACDAGGPPDPAPGQFYMLSGEERWGGEDGRPYLPRAFSYARVRPAPGGGAELDFLLEEVGPGTRRLAELEPGEGLGLVGPLGRGFRLDTAAGRPLLVGGGIGVAPLLCLSDELGPQTPVPRPQVLLGFRSAAHAEAARLFAGETALTTDDGSVGRAGLVTDLLREALDPDRSATVFACGPPPMLEAVHTLCTDLGVPSQLALESGMACGFGACMGCVVQTNEGYVRLCLDGPVLDGEILGSGDWGLGS
jgi:dihydroorotate dehydrogenase electron transfer subunit